jgi:sugar phosphate isomerase/epimerase
VLTSADWVLCAGTLPQASIRERIELAAAYGFGGVSFFVTDHQRARDEGLSDDDVRRLLQDNGLETAELDALMNWLPSTGLADSANAQGRGLFGSTEDDFYALRDVVGGRVINCVLVSDEAVPSATIADAFGALCERAARHDLDVVLEFLPWTQIDSAQTALDIVERAGASNGGLMIDSWHLTRSGDGPRELAALPQERILGVQINDAPLLAESDLVAETLQRRRLPGDGDIPLREIVDILRAGASPAPIGVEIYSSALGALPADETMRRIVASLESLSGPTPIA